VFYFVVPVWLNSDYSFSLASKCIESVFSVFKDRCRVLVVDCASSDEYVAALSKNFKSIEVQTLSESVYEPDFGFSLRSRIFQHLSGNLRRNGSVVCAKSYNLGYQNFLRSDSKYFVTIQPDVFFFPSNGFLDFLVGRIERFGHLTFREQECRFERRLISHSLGTFYRRDVLEGLFVDFSIDRFRKLDVGEALSLKVRQSFGRGYVFKTPLRNDIFGYKGNVISTERLVDLHADGADIRFTEKGEFCFLHLGRGSATALLASRRVREIDYI